MNTPLAAKQQAPSIRRLPGGDAPPVPAGFAALRAEAVAAIQAATGQRWTDHNLHDPGITLLEQLCYALTEGVYRADLPVADHLCREDGSIDFDAQSLHLPQDVFPCRAGSAQDLRRLLLDRVPEIDDLVLITQAPDRSGRVTPGGLLRLRLKLSASLQGQAELQQACVRAVLRACRAERTLGEDVDDEVELVERQPCTLHAMVEIQGGRPPASLLAEIYDLCASHIAGRVRSHSLGERLNTGRTLEQIFTGPPPLNGFIDEAEAAAARPTHLFISDLRRRVQEIDGVREVSFLALQLPGHDPSTGSVPWRGEQGALSLLVPGDAGYRPQVALLRRGNEVALEAAEVRAEFEARRSARPARTHALAEASRLLPPPTGVHHRRGLYYSVQNQFPAVYGVGPEGLPAAAGSEQRARVRQLRGYLALCEQVMAHSGAQLDHLAELYSARLGERPASYWWAMLDDHSVPGIEALYADADAVDDADAGPRDDGLKARQRRLRALRDEVYASRDDACARRHRAFDHLLALHGQTCAQNTLRQFLGHLDHDERELRLLRNKQAFLRQTLALSRHRGAGIDPGRDPAARIGLGARNASGLQRVVSLLLDLPHRLARPLARPLHARGWQPGGGELRRGGLAPEVLAALQPLLPPKPATSPWLRKTPLQLPRGALHAGLQRSRYRWLPAQGGRAWLLLADDAEGVHWWQLALCGDAEQATQEADRLRRWMLALDRRGEGLHVIEHVLLRPRCVGGPLTQPGLGADFYTLRVSVVFSAWTLRGADPAFRKFADETVQINAPSHVLAQCLWLDFEPMLKLEKALELWRQRLRDFTEPAAGRPAVDALALDEAAHAVIEQLRAAGVR